MRSIIHMENLHMNIGKLLLSTAGFVAVALSVGVSSHSPATSATANMGCSDATVHGNYAGNWVALGFNGSAPTTPAPITKFIPSSVNGTASFDGQGHWSATGTTNFGGIYGPFSIHGPYHVRTDCTGHFSEPGLAFDFIVFRHGDQLSVIESDGQVAAFQLNRVDE
jgi:hypothetical protein